MAQTPTGEEKTEQPTAKRKSTAIKQGHVPFSMEMSSAVSLLVLTVALVLWGPRLVNWFGTEMRLAFSCDHSVLNDPTSFVNFAGEKVVGALWAMAPFLAVLSIASVITSMAISGRHFHLNQALKMKWNVINPSKALPNMFSKSQAVKLGLSIAKLGFVGLIALIYVRNRLDVLVTLQWTWDMGILAAMSRLILGVLIRIVCGLMIIGILDLIYQKWKYIEDLKMSKKEVKEERRAQDGPPEVKRKLRQKQFEAAVRRMMQEVPDANVVLVNPTHVAVALKYDPQTMEAPIVVAKGADHVCEKIKEVARAYGVPIIRRPTLARGLFAGVDIGSPIPDAMYVAVAEVLALVYRLKQQRAGAAR